MPVKLGDIVDAIEMQMPDASFCLQKKTGKIVSFSHDVLHEVEETPMDKLLASCPKWQQDEYKAARDFLDHQDDFVELPDEFAVDEYGMMERFCGDVTDEAISGALYRTIKGKGAFRRFKDAIHRFGIQQKWYDFRHAEIAALAREWCEANAIEFTED